MIKPYSLILFCALVSIQAYAQNRDSLKLALVQSKSILSNNQVGAYYPELDCVGAIPICLDTFVSTTIYSGRGYYQEISNQNSCLGLGEYRAAWYKIYTTQPGFLGFNIIPADTNDDYDWAVFNLTNSSCSDVFTNASLEVLCSFSGYEGTTGANDGTEPGDKPRISVDANSVFYLYVSYFNDSGEGSPDSSYLYQSGYIVDFSISSFTIDSCLEQTLTSIPENPNLIDILLYPNPAGSNITLKLNTLKQQGQGYELQLFTSTGALVQEHSNVKTVEKTIDVSTLSTGLYYYRIVTTDGKTAAGRFIKE